VALPLESVPNFSEGRDSATMDALATALAGRVELLDVHADADHNRSVFTVVGEQDELVDALLAGIACARDRIDLREHEGAHPRIGAADVVPLVPIRPADMPRAREAALELARADAAERGVEVEYVEGDMRSIPWSGRFDRVLNWFTSFGYFGDDDNRRVLHEAYKALKPGGLLAVEVSHRDNLLGRYLEEVVAERGDDRMIDRHRFDVETSRSHDERTIIRGGKQRTFEFSVRMLTAAELRDWMLDAGFSETHAFGEDGEPLTLEHRRMTVVAHK
jgi:hypothetical protein